MPSSKNKTSSFKNKKQQKGAGATDYAAFWYSSSPQNVQTLSKYTVNHLANTPMFNPLKFNTKFATQTTGLIPTGVHLGNFPASGNYFQVSKPLYLTGGGGEFEKINNNWVNFVKNYAKINGLKFRDALTSPDCRNQYYEMNK